VEVLGVIYLNEQRHHIFKKQEYMSQNILFVCSANKQRSKTGEDYFSGLYPHLHFKSCGTNIKLCEKEGTNPITEDLLSWADVIFVMESSHSKMVKQYTANKHGGKIVVLNIPDKFKYYQKELIAVLSYKVKDFL